MPSSSSERSVAFAETYAHPGDPLGAHAARVARAVATSAARWPADVRRVGLVAALCHDLGKATPFFQDYLLRTQRRTALTPHSALGACLALWLTGGEGWLLYERLGALTAVLRHHGRLRRPWAHELSALWFNLQDPQHSLWRQVASLDLLGISAFLRAEAEALALPAPPAGPLDRAALVSTCPSLLTRKRAARAGEGFGDLERAIGFLGAYGALLTHDRLDAAGAPPPRQDLPLDLVIRHREGLSRESPLSGLRAAVAREAKATLLAHPDERLFTLTSPTGSGKTLALVDAALARRDGEGQTPRLIYALPFTAVIEQTAGVLREAFAGVGLAATSDMLLEHHHQTDGVYRLSEAEHAPDGAGRLWTETWQAEVVITTYYQLLHGVLGGTPRHAARLGQLAGAIVVLDEPQALPLRYWRPVGRVLRSLSQQLGTTFILATATQPGVLPPGEGRELVASHPEHFAALDRVGLELRHKSPLELDEFLRLQADDQAQRPRAALILLNRRADALRAYAALHERLGTERVTLLSTLLTPRDRRQRIANLRERLARGEAFVLCSTQIVEAGVDLSFPEVHRDLAPLDALVQAAGRCNRHAQGPRGRVVLWSLLHEGAPRWKWVYDAPRIEATLDVLRVVLGEAGCCSEAEFPALVSRYFEVCESRLREERVDEHLALGEFDALREEFRLIESYPRRAWFVAAPDDTEADRLWQAWSQIEGRAPRSLERAVLARVVEVRGDPTTPLTRAPAGAYDSATGLDEELLP
jgi:CRISPR-associated endonuclease/helicase Cas3